MLSRFAPFASNRLLAAAGIAALVLAPNSAHALSFFRYTFDNFRVRVNGTFDDGNCSTAVLNAYGCEIVLDGSFDGPGTLPLTATPLDNVNLTISPLSTTTGVQSVTFTGTDPGNSVFNFLDNDGVFAFANFSPVFFGSQLRLSSPFTPATYDNTSNPFAPTNQTVLILPASGGGVGPTVNLRDINDQIGGSGTLTVQEVPAPLSFAALAPVGPALLAYRRRFRDTSRDA